MSKSVDPSSLNENQQAAVFHTGSPLLIIAGAGSGKTATIVAKVAHTIQSGIAPERICMLTFTNKAAQNMIDRAKLITPEAEKIVAGTFHAIAYKMLHQVGLERGFYRGQRILGEFQTQRIWEKAYQAAFKEDERKAIKQLKLGGLGQIQRWHSKLTTSGETADALERNNPEIENWRQINIKGIYDTMSNYKKFKYELNGIDFDDVLVLFFQMLSHPDIGPRIRKRFDYIFVDEYQDTSWLQGEILKLLVGDNPNLIAVGDPAQCVPADTVIATLNGPKRAADITMDDKLLIAAGQQRISHSSIRQIHTRTVTNEPFVVIELKSGTKLRTTAQHLHFADYTANLDGIPVLLVENTDNTTYYAAGTQVLQAGAYRRAWFIKVFKTHNEAADWVKYAPQILDLPSALRRHDLLAGYPHFFNTSEPHMFLNMCAQGNNVHKYGCPAIGMNAHTTADIEQAQNHFEQWRSDPAFHHLPLIETAAFVDDTEHKLLPASQLQPGMFLLRYHEGCIVEDRVVRIETQFDTTQVYDFSLEQGHNYTANGVFVHNCIYSFLSSTIENILQFQKDYKNTRVIKLNQNYRSYDSILAFSNKILSEAKETISNPLAAVRNAPKLTVKPTVHKYGSAQTEAAGVIRDIKDALARKIRIQDIAILTRQSHLTYFIELELTKANIPYVKVGGVKLTAKQHIRQFIAFLELVLDRRNWLAWESILPMIPMIGAELTQVLIEDFKGYHDWDWNNPPPLSIGAGKRAQSFRQFWERLAKIQTLTASANTGEFFDKAFQVFVPLYEIYWTNLSPEEQKKLNESEDSSEAAAATTNIQEYNKELKKAFATAPDMGSRLSEIYLYLVQLAQQKQESLQVFLDQFNLNTADTTTDKVKEPKLTVSTIHSAKGLEWPVVFVVGVEQGGLPVDSRVYGIQTKEFAALYPEIKPFTEQVYLEEERRLFYVAITRAEDELHITYAAQRYNKGRKDSPFIKPFLPKPMLSGKVDLGTHYFVLEKMREDEPFTGSYKPKAIVAPTTGNGLAKSLSTEALAAFEADLDATPNNAKDGVDDTPPDDIDQTQLKFS